MVRDPRLKAVQSQHLALSECSLTTAWQRLQAEQGVDTPFLTWQWFSALADVPAVSADVRVIVVSLDGEVIGLVPLEWVSGPGRLRTVGFAGWKWIAPDHLDVIARPELRGLVARAALDHLISLRDWDVLDLEGLDREGALARAVRRLGAPRFITARTQNLVAPFILLRGRGEQELLGSRNHRQQVRRGLRAAEQTGGGLQVVTEPDAVEELLIELMALNRARFGSASKVFATSERRQFHCLAARRLAEFGMARIYRLAAGGVNAALLYAFVLDQRVYYYSLGMVPGSTMSPGRTVLGQAILSAASEGFAEFDLLRGDHEFKRRAAQLERNDLRITVLRMSPRSVIAALGPVLLRAVRRFHAHRALPRRPPDDPLPMV